jgi:hypothetical protein
MKASDAYRTVPRVIRGARLPSLVLLGLVLLAHCTPLETGAQREAEWPPVAKKWYDRAARSFGDLDVADAEASIAKAIELEPGRPAARLLASSIALSQMRYDDAIAQLEGQASPEASGLRARALWYSGKMDAAAEELESLLEDPEVEDPWARGVARLARSGAGREPFRMTGALLAVVEMPVMPLPTMIVPLELNGEPALAMVATGSPEVVVDSQIREESWVSLRFAQRLEVKDVPALSRDLSPLSRRVGAPIKLLLGVNLLRRLNVTLDFYANQFVARSFAPPPPPDATAIDVSYIKGGGMVIRSRFGEGDAARGAPFLIDTSVLFPLALADSGWQKPGLDPSGFASVPGEQTLKQGRLPHFLLGAYDLPDVPGVHGLPLGDLEQGGGIRLDGVIGAGLVASFRVSLVEEGRVLWLEEAPRPLPASDAAPVSSLER